MKDLNNFLCSTDNILFNKVIDNEDTIKYASFLRDKDNISFNFIKTYVDLGEGFYKQKTLLTIQKESKLLLS